MPFVLQTQSNFDISFFMPLERLLIHISCTRSTWYLIPELCKKKHIKYALNYYFDEKLLSLYFFHKEIIIHCRIIFSPYL